MSRDPEPDRPLLPDWDRRVWGAVVLTALWMLGGIVYIVSAGGWGFFSQDADTIGGFLEGFFAPVAFLWLVVGLFVQQEEIARNRDEMERSNLLSEKQARAMEEAALTARQQAFFLIADNVRRQTGNLLGAMLANEGSLSDQDMEPQWTAHAAGDFERFPRVLVDRYHLLKGEDFGFIGGVESLFFGTPLRRGLAEEYIRSFRRLLRQARECDQDHSILATVLQAPHGIVYTGMLHHMPADCAWVTLLEDAGSTTGADADVIGRWHIKAEGEIAADPAAASIVTLSRDGNRLVAIAESQTSSPEAETVAVRGPTLHERASFFQTSSPEAETVAVRGQALFLRFLVPFPILMTAVIDGDRMQGQAETGQGDIFPFTANRSSEEQ